MKYSGQPLGSHPGSQIDPRLLTDEFTEKSAGVLAERRLPFEPQDLFPDPPSWLRQRSCKPGHLYWPVGASRWTLGTFLVAGDALAAIRRRTEGGKVAQAFEFDDAVRKFSTDLWMLPSAPLLTAGPCQGLHLLVLVDERWYWLSRGGGVTIEEGETTYEGLIAQIAAELGITIRHSQIDPGFGYPSASIAADCGNLALLLDRVAHATGRRVVRALNGEVTLQSPREAAVATLANLKTPRAVLAGGYLEVAGLPTLFADTPAAFPKALLFLFPTETDGAPSTTLTELEVKFTDLPLADLAGVKTSEETHRIPMACVAEFSAAGVWLNRILLTRLAKTFAAEWYRWQRRGPECKYVGHHAWGMEGYHDVEWKHRWHITEDGEVSTRLTRPAYDFPIPYEPSEPCCDGGGGGPQLTTDTGDGTTNNTTTGTITTRLIDTIPAVSRIATGIIRAGPDERHVRITSEWANSRVQITGSVVTEGQITTVTNRPPDSIFRITNTSVVETARTITRNTNIGTLDVTGQRRITFNATGNFSIFGIRFPFAWPTITGITGFGSQRISGAIVSIFNASTNGSVITIAHNSGSAATTSDRVDTGGSDISLAPKTGIDLMYDPNLARAVVVGGSYFSVAASGGASPSQRVEVQIPYTLFTAAATSERVALSGYTYTRHQGMADSALWTKTAWSPNGGATWTLTVYGFNAVVPTSTTVGGPVTASTADTHTSDGNLYVHGNNAGSRLDPWSLEAELSTSGGVNVNTANAGMAIFSFDLIDLGDGA